MFYKNNHEQILKQVSRSFYLSIRILPKPMRQPVSIAYLLARTADSITDSDQIPLESRIKYLQSLLGFISTPKQVQAFSRDIAPLMSDSGERKLFQYLPCLLGNFHSLNDNDKTHVKSVVSTLIEGMQMDLDIFSSKNTIIALKNAISLDEYTYLVAGCVGEFWTKSAKLHLATVIHWDEKKQTQLGIEFGKALQLTNILRDIAKDARLGRCYLPADTLKKNNLTTEQLLKKENDYLFRPIIFHQLTHALDAYESAERYLLTTPRIAIRLRLASIWPILIGLKTLGLIAKKENFLDSKKTIKVKRNWVYGMLFCSLFLVGSNRLLSHWILKLKQDIRENI